MTREEIVATLRRAVVAGEPRTMREWCAEFRVSMSTVHRVATMHALRAAFRRTHGDRADTTLLVPLTPNLAKPSKRHERPTMSLFIPTRILRVAGFKTGQKLFARAEAGRIVIFCPE